MKKNKLNIGVIGHGQRGKTILGLLCNMDDVNVIGVCELYEDRLEAAKQTVIEKQGKEPFATLDYHELLALKNIDAVVCPSSWDSHIPICIDAMNAGVPVGTEIGCTCDVELLWELVRTHEKTGVICMGLENACYCKPELTVLNMVKKGIFGELVHAEGGYRHDLREEIGMGDRIRHYRLDQYTSRNAELYPMHELGPIAKCLDINRGNRMVSLVSMASKARGMHEWAKTRRNEDDVILGRTFNQGDIVQTHIKCANGETISLTHDTTLPRAYSRNQVIQGTKATWCEDAKGIFIDDPAKDSPETHKWDPFDSVYEKYMHPLWREYESQKVNDPHGGIDYLVLRAFLESVRNKQMPPVDVYDLASWMAVVTLSEKSIALGSMPVPFPDFTNGKWIRREPAPKSKYSLTEIDESLYEL